MTKRILVVPNAFKGTFTALEVCDALTQALSPHFEVTAIPIADGGDGTLDVIARIVEGLVWKTATVTGPLPNQTVQAKWLWDPSNQIAYLESAQACGLALSSVRDPLRSSTEGVGELIQLAIAEGAEEIYLGLGGTCSTDGGVGALRKLGWKFTDDKEQEVLGGGGNLAKIAKLHPGPPLGANLILMTDVENRFVGEEGSAIVFGPQKGANAAQVEILDAGTHLFWILAMNQLEMNINFPGSGAAGGLAAGLALTGNASQTSGFGIIADLAELEDEIGQADLVVTGEGSFDRQSMMGKAPGRCIEMANRQRKPHAVFAGRIEEGIALTARFQLETRKFESMTLAAEAFSKLLIESSWTKGA